MAPLIVPSDVGNYKYSLSVQTDQDNNVHVTAVTQGNMIPAPGLEITIHPDGWMDVFTFTPDGHGKPVNGMTFGMAYDDKSNSAANQAIRAIWNDPAVVAARAKAVLATHYEPNPNLGVTYAFHGVQGDYAWATNHTQMVNGKLMPQTIELTTMQTKNDQVGHNGLITRSIHVDAKGRATYGESNVPVSEQDQKMVDAISATFTAADNKAAPVTRQGLKTAFAGETPADVASNVSPKTTVETVAPTAKAPAASMKMGAH